MSVSRHILPEQLEAFFRPRSIALVGATDNSRWSINTFENLKSFGFAGPIHLVHPRHEIVHGERTLKSLSDLAEPVDLAFIMVPTHSVLPVVKEATEQGIRKFVVLTSGFSEIGAEGAQLESALLAYAQEHGLTLLGPNGNGFINITDQITPYGLPIAPPLRAGPVGIVLQSGALASAVLAFAQAHAIGLSLLVSMGNESMISVTDIVDYLLEDEATQAIALFLESIRHPEELRRVAEKARLYRKPIVALKIGRSEASARSALAHTGALVGNDAINDAALRQLGILRVHSLEDLLTTAGLAGYHGPLPGRRMGIVTPSGGACDILSDLAQEEGIALPNFAPTTLESLKEVLPPFSTPHNPLDVTGYVVVDKTLQLRALKVVTAEPYLDFILYMVSIDGGRKPTPEALQSTLEQYDQLAAAICASSHPVVLISNTCIDLTPTIRAVIERTGLHIVAGMEHGIRALGRLLWWSEFIRATIEDVSASVPLSVAIPKHSLNGSWSEARTRALLQEAGIPVVPGILATSAEEAAQAARTLGLPVALKIQSPGIPHKSDVGGVALNIASEEAARAGFTTMLARVREIAKEASIEGVLVSPMRPGGIELLVGIIRDQLWGLVLTLGLGGIWTEALRDTAVRVLPIQRHEIKIMLSELRGSAILQGARGQASLDLDALSAIIERICALAYMLGPQLSALEINPLLLNAPGIEALDALISWQQ
ncbi:CoA-binding protein [Ktedonosporobacter rubrisoli]|uniref:CoA-binding protein n=1 Tax=Ktedonosporobacter rubrisoli TaxID=2509675 RepID=A0A4P6JIL9_KTERU|nr:acetate--CoA ligase family protein [Ktedonosporobacter rubrisoli]QBD74750.1 CoA-binding protein [Ktedonosporobacter rubrisoli]